MIWWTSLALREFEFPFPGSLTLTFIFRQVRWKEAITAAMTPGKIGIQVVHAHIYLYVYIYPYIHIHIYINIFIYTYRFTYVYIKLNLSPLQILWVDSLILAFSVGMSSRPR